jgi:hypothetical protein
MAVTPLNIKRTGASEYGRWIKALIVGEPGAGKTLISSTWPNVLYASAEGGLMSVADRGLPYQEIDSADSLLSLRMALDNDPATRERILGFPVDTVIIDTIDEVQRILIKEQIAETKKESMQLQDWGKVGEQMQSLIRGFRNLDMHVVFTCHIKETSDAESGKLYFKPGMQGAISDQIAGLVDLAVLIKANVKTVVVNNQTEKQIVRHIQTVPDLQHPWIKDRSGKLPAEIPVNFNDDFARINDAIFGGLPLPATESLSTPEQGADKEVIKVQSGTMFTPETVTPEAPQAPKEAPKEAEKVAETKAEPAVDMVCSDCKGPIDSENQRKMAIIRHRVPLCKTCHAARKRK